MAQPTPRIGKARNGDQLSGTNQIVAAGYPQLWVADDPHRSPFLTGKNTDGEVVEPPPSTADLVQ